VQYWERLTFKHHENFLGGWGADPGPFIRLLFSAVLGEANFIDYFNEHIFLNIGVELHNNQDDLGIKPVLAYFNPLPVQNFSFQNCHFYLCSQAFSTIVGV
jgi:hypothetical protein